MKCGTINCSCGQTFYFETANVMINCIRCDKEHDISGYPELQPVEQIEEVEFTEEPNQNGTEGA